MDLMDFGDDVVEFFENASFSDMEEMNKFDLLRLKKQLNRQIIEKIKSQYGDDKAAKIGFIVWLDPANFVPSLNKKYKKLKDLVRERWVGNSEGKTKK